MAKTVHIIGAGICGLSIGWKLARAGLAVTIFDQGQAGLGASWAAGGMLAPSIEAEPQEKSLLTLMLQAQQLWPQFAQDLLQETGIDLHLQQHGALYVARDRDDEQKLKFLHSLSKDYGLNPEWLSPFEARKLEPHLARNITAALFHPQDAHVDNRATVLALQSALIRAGGKIIENMKIESIAVHDNAIRSIHAAEQDITCDHVIIAAGAWSSLIKGLPENCIPPVRPVKGQMIALAHPASGSLLERMAWSPDVYIVPQHNRLLIGASVEEMGFDTSLTAGAQMDLLQEAYRILPGIYDLPIIESWGGLRPTSRDDAPILGATDVKGLYLATGHHRNGIQLAPLTAQYFHDLLVKDQDTPAIQPFTIRRFAA